MVTTIGDEPIGTEQTVLQTSVQQRISEVIADLGLNISSASRLAGINPGQLHRAIFTNRPGSDLLVRLARAWGVPVSVFFVSGLDATDAVQSAKASIDVIREKGHESL